MLTEQQAKQVVDDSLKRVAKDASITRVEQLAPAQRDDLAYVISSDPNIGVMRFQHTIDPNKVDAAVRANASVDDFTDRVMKLSSGKVCSNPSSPHEQEYPYPAKCPECGALVL